MKQLRLISLVLLTMASGAYAATPALPPNGEVTFYNSSKESITAEVSTLGKFTLESHESKQVAYSSLMRLCSATPTNCKAHFFVNSLPAGYAVMNVILGKIVHVNSSLKVLTTKGAENIVRHIMIK